MEFRTSIVKRSGRMKSVKMKDGTTKKYETKGGFFFRVHYIQQPNGRPTTIEKGPFKLKVQAKDALNARINEITAKGGRGQERGKRNMTFAEYSEYCLEEGIYAEGTIKSRRSMKVNIKNLGKYFNPFKIKDISRESLREYKQNRLNQYAPTKKNEPKRRISQATVNRELATLRAMLFYAIGEGWIVANPFFKNRGLISIKNEEPRDRILSQEEEHRLLAACEGEWTIPWKRERKITDKNGHQRSVKDKGEIKVTLDNRHLTAMIMIAIDSGLRLGEILKLEWSDIDFANNQIVIRSYTTKTGKGRRTILSERAEAALERLRPITDAKHPFPYVDIKRSFNTAKKLAQIDDLRFHDLRRTAITRWQMNGVPLAFAGKSAGHSQLQTTQKHYTVIDDSQLDLIRNGVDAFNSAPAVATESIN